MDVFEKTVGWHPRFLPIYTKDAELLLIGEAEQFAFAAERFQEWMHELKSPTHLSQLLLQSADLSHQATWLNTIETLLTSRILADYGSTTESENYKIPNFLQPPTTCYAADDQFRLHLLTQFETPEFWRPWADRLALTLGADIAIVDDYLDPRLEHIDRACAKNGTPWIIIKPTGTHPTIGPRFTPNIPQTPCWQCLATRMLNNQPVRQWISQSSGVSVVPPSYFQRQAFERFITILERGLLSLNGRLGGRLFRFDLNAEGYAEHTVVHRPQCRLCGPPNANESLMHRPIQLQPTPKRYIDDGGVRAINPEQTVKSILPHVSPITGVIAEFSSLTPPRPDAIVIYRSSFFKTPLPQKSGLNNSDFVQVSLGKGVSHTQSKASALCESVERYACQYRGDEPSVVARPDELDARAILPDQLVHVSNEQLKRVAAEPTLGRRELLSTRRYQPKIPLQWIAAWSLTNDEPCYLPLTACYANTPFDEERYIRFCSNGCASGNNSEEALLQGFFELIERDATAVWWYNQLERPAVDLTALPPKALQRFSNTLGSDWDYWVLDLTHDFEIPVMVALAQHRHESTFCFGFGCHLDPKLACQRALTELCQLIPIRNNHAAPFEFSAIEAEPFLYPNPTLVSRSLDDYSVPHNDDIKSDIEHCVDKARQLGFETVVCNISRPDLPIPTFKVVVPGLCHIWPQLGNKRLYQLPVDLGWQPTPRTEAELNPIALMI